MRRCELRRKDRLACRGTPRGVSRWLRRDREPPVWRPRDPRCAPRSGARALGWSVGEGERTHDRHRVLDKVKHRAVTVNRERRSTGALAWSTRSDVRATTGLATVARAERADASRPVVILVGGPRFKGPWISLTSGQVALQVGTSAEVRGAMCGSRSNGRNTPASPTRAWRSTPRQLADMGYVAPIRVSRPPHSLCRSTNFWTLPVEVFGSGPNSIASGHL